MAHYTVPSNSGRTQKLFRICGYGLTSLMLVLLGLSQVSWLNDRWSHALGWAAMSLLVLALTGIPVLIFSDTVNQFWRKISFEIVDNKIVRLMEGRAPIEFPFDKISFIGESRNGLVVRGGKPLKGFVIPRTVEGFQQLKQQLNDHCEIIPIASANRLFRVFPLIVVIALYVLLLTAKSRSLILAAGAAGLLFQGCVIVGMRKIWAKTRSPKLVASGFILTWLVLFWLAYERFFSVP
jgi:hypothetical protein